MMDWKLLQTMIIPVILAMFALVILGAVLIIDYQNLLGILPISVAAVLSLAQIILGIVFYKKNH